MDSIRAECLRPFIEWQQPNGQEVRAALELAGLSDSAAANVIGLSKNSGKTVRRWINEETTIPYACWAILADCAGYGVIWKQ